MLLSTITDPARFAQFQQAQKGPQVRVASLVGLGRCFKVKKLFDLAVSQFNTAKGDLGPMDGYVGDVRMADRNGRQLGFAALSALEALPSASVPSRRASPGRRGRGQLVRMPRRSLGEERSRVR